jgi:hypothetical protein
MFWASPAAAQQAAGDLSGLEVPPEFRLGLGWYGVLEQEGNNIAGEYQHLKSSGAGIFDAEWDPLPHRFVLESYFLNEKDYFGELDYSYRDVVVLNGYVRDLFHNLNHYSFGLDDPATLNPSFTDLNPEDVYGIENRLSRGFLRLKTPDFPFHLNAEVRTVDREGMIQQRFLRAANIGELNKVSRSREADWNTSEYRVGMNSHLGPVEAEYIHAEKKFEVLADKVLFDDSSGTAIPHNLIPDLSSSSDTVKLHTSYSGRFVLAGTYTTGDKKNEDSRAAVEFINAAGDLMYMPVTSVILTLRYRHHDLDAAAPDTVNAITVSGIQTRNVRDAISSTRDVVSGVLRYRATEQVTVRGEYTSDTTDRTRGMLGSTLTAPPANAPDFWVLPESTTKNTARIGLTYRVMNKMTVRADYSMLSVDNPAYDVDPDKANAARASLTWLPTPGVSTLFSLGMDRQTRDNLSAPLGGGSRDAERDQALASVTMIVGKLSSVTATYAYFKNRIEQTVTYTDDTGAFLLEPEVPYADIAHTGSLSLTVAPSENFNLIASADKSFLRGDLDISGSVSNTGGIAPLTNLKAIDTVYTAGVEAVFGKHAIGEVRYQQRRYDDEMDDAQDGTMKLVIATLSLKW